MNREYYKVRSRHLDRDMELLIFGHAGLPLIVFPTSGGRFFDFENHGMVAALAGPLETGRLQLCCVDSVDHESWYNHKVPPRMRVARQQQYERHLLHEVLPPIRCKNHDLRLMTMGCSMGGYQAVNLALRHPELFTGFLSLSGVFDLSLFLDGYCDEECYFHLPTYYLPNLADPWYLTRMAKGNYTLATGWDDVCLGDNQNLDRILREKGIAHRFEIWSSSNTHDWPTWRRMAMKFLGDELI